MRGNLGFNPELSDAILKACPPMEGRRLEAFVVVAGFGGNEAEHDHTCLVLSGLRGFEDDDPDLDLGVIQLLAEGIFDVAGEP